MCSFCVSGVGITLPIAILVDDDVRARVANAEERATLWPNASGLYSGYERYQELAGDREIELVICVPRGS